MEYALRETIIGFVKRALRELKLAKTDGRISIDEYRKYQDLLSKILMELGAKIPES